MIIIDTGEFEVPCKQQENDLEQISSDDNHLSIILFEDCLSCVVLNSVEPAPTNGGFENPIIGQQEVVATTSAIHAVEPASEIGDTEGSASDYYQIADTAAAQLHLPFVQLPASNNKFGFGVEKVGSIGEATETAEDLEQIGSDDNTISVKLNEDNSSCVEHAIKQNIVDVTAFSEDKPTLDPQADVKRIVPAPNKVENVDSFWESMYGPVPEKQFSSSANSNSANSSKSYDNDEENITITYTVTHLDSQQRQFASYDSTVFDPIMNPDMPAPGPVDRKIDKDEVVVYQLLVNNI